MNPRYTKLSTSGSNASYSDVTDKSTLGHIEQVPVGYRVNFTNLEEPHEGLKTVREQDNVIRIKQANHQASFEQARHPH